MKKVELRKTQPSDLDILFDYQADDEAGYMAAFVSNTWKDREGYRAKWEKLLAEGANSWTILCDGTIVGSIGIWMMNGEPQITYGIGRAFWGQGLASAAMELYLPGVETYPLYGRAASDNTRSIRLLQKSGFKKIGTDRAFAAARNGEIEESIFRLDKYNFEFLLQNA